MPTKLRLSDILVCVLFEGLLVFMSMVPFGGGDNPWLFAKPYAVMLVLTIILFALFLYVFKWESFILHFIASVAVFVLGVVLGLPIVLSFITAMLLLWRLTDALNGNTLNHLWIIYLASVGIAFLCIILLGLLNMDFPHRLWFLYIFFAETVLTVLLHYLQVAKNGQFGKKMSTSYAMTFGGVIVVAAIFAGIGPFISKILRLMMEWVGLLVFYVVNIFWTFIVAHRSPDAEKIWKGLRESKQKAKDPTKMQELAQQTPHHYTTVGIVFVIIVGLLVFFYLKRKWNRDGSRKPRMDLHREAFNGEMKRSIGIGGRKARIKAPKDPVRLGIFQLQKRLIGQKEGRIAHETVGEWLGRLPSDKDLSIIRSIYEKVRYGRKSLRPEELAQYQQAITTVKEQIKKPDKKKTSLWEK